MFQLFCPVARLLEELPAGRTLRLLSGIDPAARQLQRESPQRLSPLAHEHNVSCARDGHNGGEPATLEDPVLDPCPTRQLDIVHAEGAPRVPVEIVSSQRPPATVFHVVEYRGFAVGCFPGVAQQEEEGPAGPSPCATLRPPTRSSWRPWWCSSPCLRGLRPRGKWPQPGTPARKRRSRCTLRG